jgi:hypothetical protein
MPDLAGPAEEEDPMTTLHGGKVMRIIATVVLLLMCVGAVYSMSSVEQYGRGHIYPFANTPEIDGDLEVLMNLPGRVYGDRGFFSEIGDWENLYFEGGPRLFNKFLEQYARVKGLPLTMSIHVGRPIARQTFGAPLDSEIHYDWRFTRYTPGSKVMPGPPVNVELWLGGNVPLEEVSIPPGIEVKSGEDKPNEEIDRFLTRLGQQSLRDFGIYVLKDKTMNALNALKANFAWQAFEEKPLLGMDDFVWYRWKDHAFKLTPEAAKRLPSPGVCGIPFFVIVDGKRVYQGGFWTSVSSAGFPGPIIEPRPVAHFEEGADRTVFTIERAYPGATEEQLRDDPRDDPAIQSAFEKAGKLR